MPREHRVLTVDHWAAAVSTVGKMIKTTRVFAAIFGLSRRKMMLYGKLMWITGQFCLRLLSDKRRL